MKHTAFVAHPDCSRHDTGWRQPDHQGRLPALVRALERDMLTLHGHVLQVEAVPATEVELLRVHTPDHLRRVRAEVPGASWDAAVAAAGSGLSAVRAICAGEAENAFCAARPPGRGAYGDARGEFSIFNNVAVAARSLTSELEARHVLIVDWAPEPPTGTLAIFAQDPQVEVLCWRGDPAPLAAAVKRVQPEWILLSATLADDPLAIFRWTEELRRCARSACGGRLVSVLEGGWDAAVLGRCAVQHLRALAGLPQA